MTFGLWDGAAHGYGTTTDVLHVRSQPDIGATVIGAWATGQALILWARVGDWWLCQARENANKLTGWSHAAYVHETAFVNITKAICP